MYRPNNFSGANMQSLVKQAQKMQEELQKNMARAEEELENAELTATAGGGMVSVTVSGKKTVKNITIKPEAVDPDDVEMLEDMVLACVNEALAKADELEKQKKGNATAGMGGLGGLF